MSARDQEVHDALVRTIAHRLPACSEAELRALDIMLVALEEKRDRERYRVNKGAVR